MNQKNEKIRIEITNDSSPGFFTHADYKLFFCMQGRMEVTVENQVHVYEKNGVLLVNPREHHSWKLREFSICAVFYIAAGYMDVLASQTGLYFACDSSVLSPTGYEQLQNTILKTLNVHRYQRWQEKLKEEQYISTLFHILLKNYAVWEKQEPLILEDKQRMQAIVEYIHGNYNRQISLFELAEETHLSMPYLSKYIKQNLKCGFLEYLNSVRLSHTVDDLSATDHPMTKVAFDNGFSSVASFNRTFKDFFGITPSEFRKKNSSQRKEQKVPSGGKDSKSGIELLTEFLRENPISDVPIIVSNELHTVIDTRKKQPFEKVWEKVWNLGCAEELRHADVQEHVRLLYREFRMKSVRVIRLFTSGMLIHIGTDKVFNFSRIDQVLDFLTDNQMLPFLDLGFHPKELYTKDKVLLYEEEQSGYSQPEAYLELIRQFVEHVMKRYGKEKVMNWGFELPKDDRLFPRGGDMFFQIFEKVSAIIKKQIPQALVGGGAVFLYDDMEIFDEVVRGWIKRSVHPDFISIWVYPYNLVADTSTQKQLQPSGNPDYIIEKIEAAGQILKKYQGGHIPLYVTKWDMTLSCRNYLNESCYRAAYLLRTQVACLGKASLMSVFGSTDLLCEYDDSVQPFNGSYGLISKNAIKKPAFFAYSFLKQCGQYLLGKGENYLISGDREGRYYILLFFCGRLDMDYYYQDEQKILPSDIAGFFEQEELEITIDLEHVENGNYQVKRSILAASEGGVLREWRELAFESRLSKEEIEYLQSVCVPRLHYGMMTARNGKISIRTILSTNEIQLIQLDRNDGSL